MQLLMEIVFYLLGCTQLINVLDNVNSVFYGTEVISVDELKAYVAKNNLDTQMISKWQQLFDPDKTGKITFPKFCEVLGLSPAQAVAMKTQQQSASLKLHPDIIVIYEQLPLQKQVEISNKTLELLHSSPRNLMKKNKPSN
ncbi:unnamed protein product [Heterobilharzia americana]|nr:unnamed protein product [Heterobilharzia americana]